MKHVLKKQRTYCELYCVLEVPPIVSCIFLYCAVMILEVPPTVSYIDHCVVMILRVPPIVNCIVY